MKQNKTTGTDANSVLKKHLSVAQKKKKKKMITIIVVVVLVVAAVTVVVIKLRDSVTENYASSESTVQTSTASLGDISTTLSGSGTLIDDDVEDVDVPSAVEIDTVMVEEGDTVAEGDIIATLNTASVISAMADIQDQMDVIDTELKDVSDTVASKMTAGIDGRVKKIYAEANDDVASVMYDSGALMLISLDGLMSVEVETDAKVQADDAVLVTLSDGSIVDGTVQSVKDGKVTVTISDDGPAVDDAVSVSDTAGTVLGTGTLTIHSEFKVTGYAGTISKIYVSENQKVSESTKVIYLTDTSYTANYDELLKERESLEDELNELIKLYKQGAVFSPIAGVVYSVDYDEDESSTTTDTSAQTAAAATGTATAAAATGTATAAAATETASTGTDAAAESDDSLLIATVCPNATMSVTVDMDESDILSLKVGQEAVVTIDSIGEDEFTGTVTDIDTTGTSSNGVTVFAVEVTIDKTEQMLAGMSATVDITIESVENVLLIPEEALQQTSTTAYVYTEYNEETNELGGMVEVQTGLSNGTNVEISSGLSEGDTVYYEKAEEETQSWFGRNNMDGGMPGGGDFPQMPQGGMPGGQ